ncbi:MAG: translocation/assembly module TamB domain-containing protein, partial [Deltaproteobacteria bacterium]|nr:translocation/assembly module TamB domain-containing protein [Deltaproteobacteria bacterium]
FNIIEELKQAQTAEKEIRQAATQGGIPLKLDITVKNLGDLMIDNNVGRIGLATELHIGGVLGFPKIDGAVTVTEGEVHYLGLNFEITRGFIDFRDAYAYPYLEVDAEQDIGDAHITAKLHGRTNNLAMDLSGTSPQEGVLEKKDVLSLLLFGETTNERQQRSALNQEPLGSEIAAEQLARVLQRPIAGFTKLDIFRLEATPGEDGRVRRFELGKKINDRLSVELASELKQDDISQAFQLEYWLTDFFILKGSRSTDQSYSMGGGFKFLSR